MDVQVRERGAGGAGRDPGTGVARRVVREVGLGLITLGVVILLFVVYQLFGTNLAEASSQSRLQAAFDHSLRAAPAPRSSTTTTVAPPAATGGGSDSPTVGAPAQPATPAVPAGGAIDHLVIPAIGVDKYVVQGVGEAQLQEGPGHYPDTPMPGQTGNVGIAGHRTTYGAPFYRLNELHPGDAVLLTDTSGKTYRYQVFVASLVVAPTDVAVLDPTPDAELTLTTCNPRFSASSRLVVKARLAATLAPSPRPAAASPPVTATPQAPAPAAAPSPPAPSPPATLTSGDAAAWPPALGYGLGAVALWVATRLALARTRRWARAGVAVGGVAVCCVPLWFCFENVIRLLPQSI